MYIWLHFEKKTQQGYTSEKIIPKIKNSETYRYRMVATLKKRWLI